MILKGRLMVFKIQKAYLTIFVVSIFIDQNVNYTFAFLFGAEFDFDL